MPAPLRNRGFTYIGLIIMVAVIGVASTASLQAGSILQRRAAEQALLDIGTEFRNALLSYAAATPAGQSTMPATLEELLLDPRYPGPVRHLRKLYADPVTGAEEWGVVTMPGPAGEGIVGVHSLSEAAPIKVANFEPPFEEFAGKESYREWKFQVPAQVTPLTPATPATPVKPATPATPARPSMLATPPQK